MKIAMVKKGLVFLSKSIFNKGTNIAYFNNAYIVEQMHINADKSGLTGSNRNLWDDDSGKT